MSDAHNHVALLVTNHGIHHIVLSIMFQYLPTVLLVRSIKLLHSVVHHCLYISSALFISHAKSCCVTGNRFCIALNHLPIIVDDESNLCCLTRSASGHVILLGLLNVL